MGCCCSSEDGHGSESGEPNARTPLLTGDGQPRAGITAGTGCVSAGGDSFAGESAGRGDGRARGDGETQLDAILQDMASAVIDVAAVDTQTIEQHDYLERCGYYSAAVAHLTPLPVSAGRAAGLMVDVPQPERLLAAPPARPADVRLARALAERMHQAVRAVQVVPRQSLVVPFGQVAVAAGGDVS